MTTFQESAVILVWKIILEDDVTNVWFASTTTCAQPAMRPALPQTNTQKIILCNAFYLGVTLVRTIPDAQLYACTTILNHFSRMACSIFTKRSILYHSLQFNWYLYSPIIRLKNSILIVMTTYNASMTKQSNFSM